MRDLTKIETNLSFLFAWNNYLYISPNFHLHFSHKSLAQTSKQLPKLNFQDIFFQQLSLSLFLLPQLFPRINDSFLRNSLSKLRVNSRKGKKKGRRRNRKNNGKRRGQDYTNLSRTNENWIARQIYGSGATY